MADSSSTSSRHKASTVPDGERETRSRRGKKPPKADANGQDPSPEPVTQLTAYVILDQAAVGTALDTALAAGRVWIERPQQARAQRGDAAIKLANLRPDGTYEPGNFKAVPGSTWDAVANNLGILAEQKVVNSFVRGGNGSDPDTPTDQ